MHGIRIKYVEDSSLDTLPAISIAPLHMLTLNWSRQKNLEKTIDCEKWKLFT